MKYSLEDAKPAMPIRRTSGCQYEYKDSANKYGYDDDNDDDASTQANKCNYDSPIMPKKSPVKPNARSPGGVSQRVVSEKQTRDYGYEEAAPDSANKYRYGDDGDDSASTPANKYNYDSATTPKQSSLKPNARSTGVVSRRVSIGTVSEKLTRDYGYEEAAPYSSNKYGYGNDDASTPAKKCRDDSTKIVRRGSLKPGSRSTRVVSRRASIGTVPEKQTRDYRYEAAAPDNANKYGYGEDDASTPAKKFNHDSKQMARRSSLKPSSRSTRGVSRRASIGTISEKQTHSKLNDVNREDAKPTMPIRIASVAVNDTTSKYGYGDDDASASAKTYNYDSTKMPKRSSLKHIGGSPRVVTRRASVGTACTDELQVHIRGQRNPVLRRSSIGFKQRTEINYVESVRSLTDRPEELWFQKDEFRVMQEESKIISDKLKRGEKLTASDDIRGLEKYADAKSYRKYLELARTSVMLEQDIQEWTGDFDTSGLRIRVASQRITDPGLRTFEERAAKGAKDIEDYLLTPRTKKLLEESMMADISELQI
jgi:hypothetical protein